MSDHQPSCRKHTDPRRPPGPLGEWENEGGSVSPPAVEQAPEDRPWARHSKPGIALLDALSLGVLISNADGEIIYSNAACQRLYAATNAELMGTHWGQAIHEQDRPSVLSQRQEDHDRSRSSRFDVRMTTGSGQQIWTRHSIACLPEDRAAGCHIHTIEDISTVKASEQAVKTATDALLRERERARVTLESIGDAVISTDADGRVTYLNAVAEALTGWSREAASGEVFSRVFRVVDSDTGSPVLDPAERAMKSLDIVQIPANCLLLRADGSELAIEDSAAPILDVDGTLTGAVVVFRDRKMSRENTERMAHLARHDALTGLVNRVAFAEHFGQAINLARRHLKQVGLLFIDLDNFKQINDSLGHEMGDRLLQDLSGKLTACVRSTDLVSRYGGDEFVVLLSEVNRAEDAGRIARNISKVVAEPLDIQGRSISVDLSIGISLYPGDGADVDTLMHRADIAMYLAKLQGGRRHCFYQAGMSRRHSGSASRAVL